ncbi:hypothetical protein ABIC09_004949 [Bradyrhizobium sp. S3.12.5]|uniref:hypothetical protein n=1 Tax=Bradyrhizobium sp. S3.12.5 TaxID=3156386 RepID=UPI003390C1C7
MIITHKTDAVRESRNPQREAISRYLGRDGLGTYLFASAVLASGVANWGWQAAARLFPILEFIPAIMMMLIYMCYRSRRG